MSAPIRYRHVITPGARQALCDRSGDDRGSISAEPRGSGDRLSHVAAPFESASAALRVPRPQRFRGRWREQQLGRLGRGREGNRSRGQVGERRPAVSRMAALKAAMQNSGGLSSLISFGNLEGMLSSIIEQQNSIVRRRPPHAREPLAPSERGHAASTPRAIPPRLHHQYPTRDAVEDTNCRRSRRDAHDMRATPDARAFPDRRRRQRSGSKRRSQRWRAKTSSRRWARSSTMRCATAPGGLTPLRPPRGS